jgi:hypothetical protein
MKPGVVENEKEEHFWGIVKNIVERKQNKSNEPESNKTESLS